MHTHATGSHKGKGEYIISWYVSVLITTGKYLDTHYIQNA